MGLIRLTLAAVQREAEMFDHTGITGYTGDPGFAFALASQVIAHLGSDRTDGITITLETTGRNVSISILIIYVRKQREI